MKSMWSLKFSTKDKKELSKFIFGEHLDVSCSGPTLTKDGNYEVVAYVDERKKKELLSRKSDSMNISVLEDMTKSGVERQKEISKGNRFKDLRSQEVKGFGIKE